MLGRTLCKKLEDVGDSVVVTGCHRDGDIPCLRVRIYPLEILKSPFLPSWLQVPVMLVPWTFPSMV
jgi:hypothetical protein